MVKTYINRAKEAYLSLYKKQRNLAFALALVGLWLLWMISGVFNGLFNWGEEERVRALKNVTVLSTLGQLHTQTLHLSGITEPKSKATVRAQTSSEIEKLFANTGDVLPKGSPLLKMALQQRGEAAESAKAKLEEMEIVFKSSSKLSAQGYQAKSTLAEKKAALKAAKEAYAKALQDISHTTPQTPFDGVVEKRFVNVGDFVNIGEPLFEVIDRSTYLIVAHLPQKYREQVGLYLTAKANLVSGKEVTGTLRFIASDADLSTKTYRLEIEVPGGASNTLPTGMATKVALPVAQSTAHLIPHSALVLNDAGTLGVMHINIANKVHFTPVDIVGDEESGVWVAGLPEQARVIVRGQYSVTEGETVAPSPYKPAEEPIQKESVEKEQKDD